VEEISLSRSARLPLSFVFLGFLVLVILQGCSNDDTGMLVAPSESQSAAQPLQYLGHAYGQVDDQHALVRWVVNQWQRIAEDGLTPADLGWSYDETNQVWVEENVSRSSELWSREGEASEVSHEFSHRIELTLTRDGVAQRDFVTADHMTVYHVIRTRHFAENPDFQLENPFDYSSVGGYDAVLHGGRVLALSGEGTIDGWQVLELHNGQEDLHYEGEFSLGVDFSSFSNGCPAVRLESVISVADSYGERLERYWSVAESGSDEPVLTRFTQCEIGDGREIVDRDRRCQGAPQ
jgi:hypothetical protein